MNQCRANTSGLSFAYSSSTQTTTMGRSRSRSRERHRKDDDRHKPRRRAWTLSHRQPYAQRARDVCTQQSRRRIASCRSVASYPMLHEFHAISVTSLLDSDKTSVSHHLLSAAAAGTAAATETVTATATGTAGMYLMCYSLFSFARRERTFEGNMLRRRQSARRRDDRGGRRSRSPPRGRSRSPPRGRSRSPPRGRSRSPPRGPPRGRSRSPGRGRRDDRRGASEHRTGFRSCPRTRTLTASAGAISVSQAACVKT